MGIRKCLQHSYSKQCKGTNVNDIVEDRDFHRA